MKINDDDDEEEEEEEDEEEEEEEEDEGDDLLGREDVPLLRPVPIRSSSDFPDPEGRHGPRRGGCEGEGMGGEGGATGARQGGRRTRFG